MRSLYFVLLFVLVIEAAATVQHPDKNSLDGKVFNVTLTSVEKQHGWQWKNDELSFKTNTFASKTMSEHEHFFPAPYKSKADSTNSRTEIRFDVHSKNSGGSQIKWSGYVIGDSIHGQAVWKNHQGLQSFVFSGVIKE